MKRNVLLIHLCLLLSITTFSLSAQTRKSMNVADYEKRKMQFVEEQAGLTKEEANRYFPLNTELSKKKLDLNMQYRNKVQNMRKNNQEMSEEEYLKLLNNDEELKTKEAELEKEYAEKFKKALSPEKLYRAQQAEKNFMQKEVNNFRSNQGTNNPMNRNNQEKRNSNNRNR